MRRVGADRVVSADTDFDRIGDVERLDPAEVGEWGSLVLEEVENGRETSLGGI